MFVYVVCVSGDGEGGGFFYSPHNKVGGYKWNDHVHFSGFVQKISCELTNLL